MTDAPERIWAVIGYAKGTDIRGEFASSVTSFWRDQKPVSYILATPDALASSPEVAALIAEARREERERCAVVADRHLSKVEINETLWHDGQDWAAESIALAIRALKEETP